MNNIHHYILRQEINQKNFFKPLLVPTEQDFKEMTITETKIYLFLTRQCHDYRLCRISQTAVGLIVGCKRETVNKLMKKLQQKRFIMGFFNGFNQTKTYVVSASLLDKELRQEMAPLIPSLNLHIYKNVTLPKKERNTYKNKRKKTKTNYYNFDYQPDVSWEILIRESTWGPPGENF